MAKSRIQKRSRLQERRAAKDVGGRVQAGSGNSWRSKGDVRDVSQLRMECKYTGKSTYVLQLSDLEKIQLEALKGGLEEWAMQIEFVTGAGSSVKMAVGSYLLLKDRWKQHGSGDLFESYTETEAKSVRLSLSEIWNLDTVARAERGGWLWQFVFKMPNGLPKCYGLTSWDIYTEMLNKEKAA